MSLDPSIEIDIDAVGKTFGRVVFPLEEPWLGRREVALPVCVIANGTGPTVSLWGGNHGDEYEGPIVLGQLARELDAAAIEGRLIILPALNPPALLACQRVSAVDGKNMNRVWPGDRSGSITDRIVAFLDRLLSLSDVLMDLHTGGNAFDLIPMSMCHHTEEPAFRDRIRAAQMAYNAPLSVELRLAPDRATASGRAHDRGVLVVGSESGGGRPVTPASLGACHDGVRNTLAHLEVLPAPSAPGRSRQRTRFTKKWGHEAEMLAPGAGIFVPFHRLWDEVVAGQPAGQLIRLDAPFAASQTILFPSSGMVAGRRARSGVAAGDPLYWIVRDIIEPDGSSTAAAGVRRTIDAFSTSA
jgi:predicted deacylase